MFQPSRSSLRNPLKAHTSPETPRDERINSEIQKYVVGQAVPVPAAANERHSLVPLSSGMVNLAECNTGGGNDHAQGPDCFGFDLRASAVDEIYGRTAIFTRLHVVDDILDRVGWPMHTGTLLDPSCGDGAFLIGALARQDLRFNDTTAALRVRGWEIHPGAVKDCRDRVERFLCDRGWTSDVARSTAIDMVVEADFLTDGPRDGQFDIIAGNPPYLRFGHLPEFFKSIYAISVAEYARGDLLHMFLDRCCRMLPHGRGKIGLVTSDRWIGNVTTANLRSSMGERVSLEFIKRIDCATSFYRPKRRVKGSPPRIHPIMVVLCPRGKAGAPISRAAFSAEATAADAYTGKRLGDVAQVRIAPWLGPAGAFVVDQVTASHLEGADLVPAVDTDDIRPGTSVVGRPTRWAIRTIRNVEPSGSVAAHLKAWRSKMPSRCKDKDYWLPPETITLSLDRPALLIPRISKTLRFAEIPPGVLPINHNISVVGTGEGYSLEDLKRILLSASSQDWIQRHAARLEGGYLSITTTLLRRLPIIG